MVNGYSEINIFTHDEGQFRRQVAVYVKRGYEFESIKAGIVSMLDRSHGIEQLIHIYAPIDLSEDRVRAIIKEATDGRDLRCELRRHQQGTA